jgi:hypothetical protein
MTRRVRGLGPTEESSTLYFRGFRPRLIHKRQKWEQFFFRKVNRLGRCLIANVWASVRWP